MRRPRVEFLAVLLPLGFLAAGPVAPAYGQGAKAAAARKEILDLRRQILDARARLEVLKQEEALLPRSVAGPPPATVADLADPAAALRIVRDILDKPQARRIDALAQLRQQAEAEAGAALKDWQAVTEAELAAEDELDEARATAAGNPPTVWDGWFLLLMAWGVVVVLCGVALALQVARRTLRRWARARGVGAAAAVLLLALPLLAADREKEKQDLNRELSSLAAQIETKKKAVDDRRAELIQVWETILGSSDLGRQLPQWEADVYERMHGLLLAAKKIELAAKDKDLGGEVAVVRTQKARQELAGLGTGGWWLVFRRRLTQVGACLGVAALAFVPYRVARKRQQRRMALEAAQCPCCLANGKLRAKDVVPDERYTEPHYLECTVCVHEFPASYSKVPRLCFPTVGVRSGGKTHWLLIARKFIKDRNVPVAATVEKVPSVADEQFDVLERLLLLQNQGPKNTVDGLPQPLTFFVQDVDRYGSSQGLLNMFDYSGEMLNKRINVDVLRRRALMMDGFFYFLDPTQVRGGGDDVDIEYQKGQLSHFQEDMRQTLGPSEVRRLVDVPVAVCISKLDLLINKNPLGGQSRQFIRELLATTPTEDRPLSLRTLRERSELCERYLRVMFPGWVVQKTLRDTFGKCFLFFPMTPVGLIEHELGETDLTRRTYHPFGVVEPILWLLHMQGYNILPAE